MPEKLRKDIRQYRKITDMHNSYVLTVSPNNWNLALSPRRTPAVTVSQNELMSENFVLRARSKDEKESSYQAHYACQYESPGCPYQDPV